MKLKNCKIIVVASKDKVASLGQLIITNNGDYDIKTSINEGLPKDIIVLSDDLINDGDYCYSMLEGKVIHYKKEEIDNDDVREYGYRKVISSNEIESLPKVSEDFKKVFIEHQGIVDISVMYEISYKYNDTTLYLEHISDDKYVVKGDNTGETPCSNLGKIFRLCDNVLEHNLSVRNNTISVHPYKPISINEDYIIDIVDKFRLHFDVECTYPMMEEFIKNEILKFK